MSGPISVSVICFDPDGSFRVDSGSFVEPADLAAGATGSMWVNSYGDVCPVGLVAASGHSK